MQPIDTNLIGFDIIIFLFLYDFCSFFMIFFVNIIMLIIIEIIMYIDKEIEE